jgi:hypothetical protein
MLNKNAKKWIRALRSGKFKQGKSVLATVDGKFCCLGIACELAVKAGIIRPKRRNSEGNFVYGANNRKYLPTTVQKWLGLTDNEGPFKKEGINSSLSEENDRGVTFKKIADIIESEPDGLFKV